MCVCTRACVSMCVFPGVRWRVTSTPRTQFGCVTLRAKSSVGGWLTSALRSSNVSRGLVRRTLRLYWGTTHSLRSCTGAGHTHAHRTHACVRCLSAHVCALVRTRACLEPFVCPGDLRCWAYDKACPVCVSVCVQRESVAAVYRHQCRGGAGRG